MVVGVFVGAWAAVRAIDPSIINLSKGRGGAADCGGDFSRPHTLSPNGGKGIKGLG